MNAKTVLFMIIALLFLAGGVGCKEKEQVPQILTATAIAIVNYADPATDGCGWTLSIENMDYHPVDLAEEYKVNGLKVKIEYQPLESMWSCPS